MEPAADSLLSARPQRPVDAPLDAVARAAARILGATPADVTRQALERARAFAGAAPDPSRAGIAAIVYVGELVAAHVLEHPDVEHQFAELGAEAASLIGIDETFAVAAIFSAALRSRTVLEVPPPIAAEAALRLLTSFAGVREASLWVRGEERAAVCSAIVGADAPSRRVRAMAADSLRDADGGDSSGMLQVVPIVHWGRRAGVLVLRTRSDERERALAYASEAAVALVAILERETLLERNAAREGVLTQSAERRLVRLGFDLHDGPLQGLASLAVDLQLLRGQATTGAAPPQVVAGRVDDLLARVHSVEEEIRDLARSLESSSVTHAPLDELLKRQVERLKTERGIEASFVLKGRLREFTASQRIAVVRFVEEAFANVRQHASAQNVTLVVAVGRAALRVVVTDDGEGFDVEQTLVQAARDGHLGLVGMSERIRLLGGSLDVTSEPGGPTVVSATIPRWEPPEGF